MIRSCLLRHQGGVASVLHQWTLPVSSRNMTAMAQPAPVLTVDNINPNIKAMEYAVRGPLVIRANELQKELAAGKEKPFKEMVFANIGDAHAMGQKPITFIRQVVSCVSFPDLLHLFDFPEDVKSRAKAILDASKGSAGYHLFRFVILLE